MKKKILISLLIILSTVGISSSVFGCALSCAAVCRYTCQGTPQVETGCSDTDYLTSLQHCCEEAFRNTPGINDVPCTEGGDS